MLRRRPDRCRWLVPQLRVSRSDRRMGTRGVGASAHHSCRANAGCCGGIWKLYSAVQPLSRPLVYGALGPEVSVFRGSYAIRAALSRRYVQERRNILRFFCGARGVLTGFSGDVTDRKPQMAAVAKRISIPMRSGTQ